MTHEIKTTITGKKYHITIAKPVSIVSIERKYVKDTVVMPRVPIKNISRISFSDGNGSLRIAIWRKTNMITLAIVNRIVITPNGFAPAS